MNNRPKKLRGLSLLQAVKSELSDALEGQEISEMELFSAANQLIELSRKEYIEPEFKEYAEKSGYYSHAVDTAMLKMQSSLWRNELQHWQDEESTHRFAKKGDDIMMKIMQNLNSGGRFA